MYRIIDGRGSGKTGRLMLLAKESDGIIVCSNPYAMKQKALAYGITGVDFISYEDYTLHNYPYGKMIFVDELEGYVRSLGNNLSGYTLSNED
jgi:hypothetical protein